MKRTCTEPLKFVDDTLEVGTEVEELAPLDHEKRSPSPYRGDLRSDERSDIDDREPREWIVVVWQGLRRRVPLRAFVTARAAREAA